MDSSLSQVSTGNTALTEFPSRANKSSRSLISDLWSGFFEDSSFISSSPVSFFSAVSTTQSAQEQISENRALAAAVLGIENLSDEDLLPGERVSSIETVIESMGVSDEKFVNVIERIVADPYLGVSESAKVALVRFSVDHVSPGAKPYLTSFLLRQLKSDSPARASAAASAIRDISDKYLVPVLKDSSIYIKWRFAKNEINRAIQESV